MIFETLKKYSAQKNAELLFHLLVMVAAVTEHSVKFPYQYVFVSLGALNLAFRNEKLNKISFAAYSVLFTNSLVNDYYMAANHFFIITYLALYLTFLKFKWIEDFRYSHFLLVLVMGLATFQKLLSDDFSSGNFMASIFLPGHSFSFMHKLMIKDFFAMSADYMRLISLVKSDPPGDHLWRIDVLESFRFYCKMHASIIIIFEMAMVFILVFFRSEIRYIFLLVFLYGTLAFRPEYVFFATLCFLSLMDTKLESIPIRNTLLFTALVFLGLAALNLTF